MLGFRSSDYASLIGATRASVRIKRGERDIWQRRYFDNLIRDEADFQAHLNYIHYNPMKHGYVKQVKDWPYSTYSRWVERGFYPLNWAGIDGDLPMSLNSLKIRRNAHWLLRLMALWPYLFRAGLPVMPVVDETSELMPHCFCRTNSIS